MSQWKRMNVAALMILIAAFSYPIATATRWYRLRCIYLAEAARHASLCRDFEPDTESFEWSMKDSRGNHVYGSEADELWEHYVAKEKYEAAARRPWISLRLADGDGTGKPPSPSTSKRGVRHFDYGHYHYGR